MKRILYCGNKNSVVYHYAVLLFYGDYSIVDDEKMAFEQGRKHRQNGHKNSATSIVAAFADKGG